MVIGGVGANLLLRCRSSRRLIPLAPDVGTSLGVGGLLLHGPVNRGEGDAGRDHPVAGVRVSDLHAQQGAIPRIHVLWPLDPSDRRRLVRRRRTRSALHRCPRIGVGVGFRLRQCLSVRLLVGVFLRDVGPRLGLAITVPLRLSNRTVRTLGPSVRGCLGGRLRVRLGTHTLTLFEVSTLGARLSGRRRGRGRRSGALDLDLGRDREGDLILDLDLGATDHLGPDRSPNPTLGDT